MNKGQKNTQYSANHYLKPKAQVIEYCLSEEDESCFQSNLAPTSYKTNNVSVHSKSTWIKTHSRIGSNVTADSINDYSQAIQDKENISDKPKDFYLKNIQTILNQKPNLTNTKPNGRALGEISNQSNILPKNKIPLEASYASGLLADLDNNIQEFRNLLSVNLPKLDTKEKPTFENGQGHEDSRVLEISRLTLKLEESKFCTENETSELKMLKEFETAHSHPTNCSLLERSLDDNRAPDLTESLQFDKPWNLMDSKANYCSGTVQAANTGYTTNTNFLRDGARIDELPNYRSSHELERSCSPNFHSKKVSDTDGTFGIFREDYESVFESFKRIMPDFSTKSHIVRYLKGHENLGNEFLYSVMLDLKEVEKNVFLMHHQSSAREKHLQDQVNELGRLSSNNQEAPNSQFRGEKTTGRGEAKSSRGDSGVITMYMRKHYQTLLQRINEFYGQKLEILKQSLSSMEKYDATKFAIGEVFDDLVEELGIEEMQGILSDNLKKIKGVHNLIGDMWNEKIHTCCGNESENNRLNKQQVLKTEGNIKTSMDFNSTGFLTTIRHDGFEAKKEDTIMEEACEIKDIEYRGEDENETRLNISEVEALRIECVLKEKENEINIIRKKEQVYQNLIRSLTMELKEAKRQNAHAQTVTTQNDE